MIAQTFLALVFGYILFPALLGGFIGKEFLQIDRYKGAIVGAILGAVVLLGTNDNMAEQPKECPKTGGVCNCNK